ncbi:MAG: hypothetical protein AAF465_01020 [Pseudomonadota bacterium]
MSKDTKTNSPSQSSAAEHDESQENVDKIRDILFGGQMRDYESRFRQLDGHISKEINRISTDINSRLDQLDHYIKNEFTILTEKLNGEVKERASAADELAGSMADMRKVLENRIADVDEVHGAAAQEMRGRMHEQATELLEAIRNNQAAIESSLRDESRKLGDEKVARTDLASLFTEVAMRLQRDFDLPDEKG